MQPCVSEPSFSEGEDNFEQKLPAKDRLVSALRCEGEAKVSKQPS